MYTSQLCLSFLLICLCFVYIYGLRINVLASVLIISMATAYLNFIMSDNAR